MKLAPGTRLGSYEVLDGIGAGGMGEVYRAHDTVLDRDVALKLVHPDFCHHPESLIRLRREARVLASVNHPNVATLHELAEFGGSCGLVMELVSGETLAATLGRRRLSLVEALRLSAQIAAALEAAHDRGVTHRDLKPANIKITTDGVVKVLDFGLAKTAESAGETGTASTLVTEQGVVLGTAPYMSPEQARGAPVDRRTDVWAFGCVLFEMLTGHVAFDGATRSDVIAAILGKEPDWSLLAPDTPGEVRRLLRRCLEKDQRQRFRDIGDVKLALEDAASPDRPGAVVGSPQALDAPPSVHAWFRTAALIGAGALLGALADAAWRRVPEPASPDEVRFAISLPEEEPLAQTELLDLAMAPSGRAIVYVAGSGNTSQLMVRALDSGSTQALQGTFGAVSPFFSPDGAWVGFFADGKLKKIAIGGGTAVAICDAADGLGGSWSDAGTIVFAAATGGPLQRVAATGGKPSRVTELDLSRGEFSHRWPELLPDGDTVLFTVGTVGEWGEAEIVAQSLTSGARTAILKGGTNPRYLPSGHLTYAHDGAIWVVPFATRNLRLNGTPTRALDDVSITADGAAQFAVSRDGASVYHPRVSLSVRRLVVVDGSSHTPLAAPPHAYVNPRVSPDGRRVLVGVADAMENIWSYDLSAGTLTQLTYEAANRVPIWSPDGQRVIFSSNRGGALNLFSAPASANGPADRLTTSDSLQLPGSWSPDGTTLAFMEQHPSTGRDIWLLQRSGERTPMAITDADESAPRFSPDGRWIAYVSNESGQAEVYVRSIARKGVHRVSTEGGTEPVWHRDGSALYYRSYARLMVAPIRDGVVGPRRLVSQEAAEPGTFDAAGYDTIGNDRFIMIAAAAPGASTSQLRVILNWKPVSPPSP